MAKPATRAVPEGVHTVTPYLIVSPCDKACDFYMKAFDAKDVMRMTDPSGKMMLHAELKIGDSLIFLADEFPQMGGHGPAHYKGTPVALHLSVPDVDVVFERAVKAGCKPIMPPMDMFWGDRFGKLEDPYGHQWSVATHKVDYTPEEIHAQMVAQMKAPDCPK